MTFRELMVVIAIACQKGGTGKSTTATNLLVCALRESLRALIIDVDPQGSACDWGLIRANAAMVEVGRELTFARSILKNQHPRGAWTTWLKTSLEISETGARNYMALAEWGDKHPIVAQLQPSAVYKAARASPEVQKASCIGSRTEKLWRSMMSRS